MSSASNPGGAKKTDAAAEYEPEDSEMASFKAFRSKDSGDIDDDSNRNEKADEDCLNTYARDVDFDMDQEENEADEYD